ncbi:putative inner membrane peptidase [Salmonella enterica subsp. enterica serovar Stanley str. ATCC 7308]|nr:putative inner membrane peptidase [Salmonella enterica subsp. enterica serovar Tennessee str. TXSC_TXSC08-21]ESF60853.1 putative inner membrane peptidase [Salmonella enterica subsp. enterica serovar Stanley str. ATCC 7308]ETC75533.1 peptidase [Salmonella enterica subsp. enterica serovar Cerro str. 5569]
MELLSEYGLFLAKIVTVVVAIAVIVLLIVNATQRKRQRGELRVTNLSEQYQEMKDDLAAALMDGHQQKLWHKAQKKSISRRRKPPKQKRSWGTLRHRTNRAYG